MCGAQEKIPKKIKVDTKIACSSLLLGFAWESNIRGIKLSVTILPLLLSFRPSDFVVTDTVWTRV